MKKFILSLIIFIAYLTNAYSQVTIATWESGSNPTLSAYPAEVYPARIENPSPEGDNVSAWVQQLTTLTDNNYEVVYTNPRLSNYIDFSNVNAISVKVMSAISGNVVLKISNYNNPAVYQIASGYYYAVNNWQDMKFYYPGATNGLYDVIALFPDYEGGARAETWYIDDIKTTAIVTPFSDDTIVNNDTYFRYFQAWSASNPLVVTNPVDPSNPNNINTSAKCLKFTSTSDGGEGIKHVFESNLDFSTKNAISLMVYSPSNIGYVELRLEGSGMPAKVVKYQYTTPGLWQKLAFDLTGTQTNAYNLMALVPDYGNTTTGIDWYFDEMTFEQETIATFESDIIADFDNYQRIFENDGNTGGITVTPNPEVSGINASANALKVNTVSGNLYEYFSTTLERKLDFERSNAMSMLVYSATSGNILLKLMGPGATPVEVFKHYTATNPATWQRLRFDTSAYVSNAFNTIQIFPDFDQARDGIWYFDELKTENIPLQGNIITNFDEFDDYSFDDWGSTGGIYPVLNPFKETGINTSNTALKMITVSAPEEGAKIIVPGLDFTSNNSISLKVYSPSPTFGIVQLRLEGPNVPVIMSGYQYTTPGHWQLLTFDLTDAKANPTSYNLIAIRPDYGGSTPDIQWYFDDFTIDNTSITPFDGDILANFESVERVFEQVNTNGTEQTANPLKSGINTTDHVVKVLSSSSTDEFIRDLRERNLDFSSKNAISIDVLSSKTGMMHLKLEKYGTAYPPFDAHCQYTERNQWQKLTFDLTGAPANVYNSISVFSDIGNTATNIPWYLDEFTFEHAEIVPWYLDTIANFDHVLRVIEEWSTKGVQVVSNPSLSGINPSDSALRVLTSGDTPWEGIKTVLDRNLGLLPTGSNFLNMNVYSASSGNVQLTLEGKNAQTKAYTLHYTATNPATWQTLSFDISDVASDTYSLIALLPDAGGNSDNSAWYFDDVAISHSTGLTLYADWDGTVTGSFVPSGSDVIISQVPNPVSSGSGINIGGHVLQVVNSASNIGAKETIGQYVDFSGGSTFLIDFYSETPGAVKLQLEGTGVSTLASSEVNYTTPGHWQALTFEFTSPKTDVYSYLSILPSTSGTWYIDNVEGPERITIPLTPGTVYADWDSISPVLSKVWGGLTDSVKPNPLPAGINQSSNALAVTTIADSLWEGFSIDCATGVFDFSSGRTFTLDVYSTGEANVLLKLENSSIPSVNPVEIPVRYTKAGSWQQLVFTFDSALFSSYNRISIFPDILGTGTADWYFDNIRGPFTVDHILILKAVGGIAEGRENGKEISVSLVGDTFKDTPWNVSNFTLTYLPSPVTIGSVTRTGPATAKITLMNNSGGPALTDDLALFVTVKKEQLTTGLQDITGNGVFITALGEYVGTRNKKVFVHYLPWYNDNMTREGIPAGQGWRDLEHGHPESITYSNMPLIGEYSQLDEDVLEYQFLTMYAAGIDGVIINMVYSREYERVITMKCLNKLKEMNEQYAASGFHLEFIISYDEKDPLTNVEESFRYVRDSLTNNPQFSSFHFKDEVTSKPVLITWAQLFPQLYHQTIDQLYENNVIHMVRDDSEFKLSDGNMEWVNYLDPGHSPIGNTVYWGEDYYDNFHRTIAHQDSTIAFGDRNYICMGAVWPGFDDHNAPWRENYPVGRWISRNVIEGETMALTFDKLNSTNYVPGALGNVKVEMPWIQVATWNDWPEGTSIEPASNQTYGYTSLKTTALKTALFKGSSVDTSRLRIPYAIFQARKNNQPEVALCLISQLLDGSSYATAINACNQGYCKYIPMPAYTLMENDQFSGAACAKMILDLERANNLTQSDIQNYAVAHNYPLNTGQPFIDPYGMFRVLNYYGSAGYNYGQVTRSNKETAYNDLCYWISNTIPNVNNPNMPSAIPTGGNYNNWMIVNGFRSSDNPHSSISYTVYGFYLKDPDANGIGQDIYIQAEAFGTNYFKPISSPDIWNGHYVTVDEPPVNNAKAVIEPLPSTGKKPDSELLRFRSVEKGLTDSKLIFTDENIIKALDGASRGRSYFVDLAGSNNDYYIVTYEKDGGCTLAAIIDANSGALKEVSFAGFPDREYCDNLKSGKPGLKSGNSGYYNSFFPPVGTISTAIGTVHDTGVQPDFDFELVPNPASDYVSIIFNELIKGSLSVELYSMTGVLVKKAEMSVGEGNGKCQINLPCIEKGIYIVRVRFNNETVVRKLIIEK
jgi:hypothetical protein